MPLVAWWFLGGLNLKRLAKYGCYTTHLRNYGSGIDIVKRSPNPWSRIGIYMGPRNSIYACYEDGLLLLSSTSPTYAPFVPFVMLVVDLSYSRKGIVLSGVESSWNSSSGRGELHLYNLLGSFSALYTYAAHIYNLIIRERRVALTMAPPRLLPQFLL